MPKENFDAYFNVIRYNQNDISYHPSYQTLRIQKGICCSNIIDIEYNISDNIFHTHEDGLDLSSLAHGFYQRNFYNLTLC